MLIHGDLSQVGKHAVLANPSSKGPREFIVLSEMQAGAEYVMIFRLPMVRKSRV